MGTESTISLQAITQRIALMPHEFRLPIGISKDHLNPASVLADFLYDLRGVRPDPAYIHKFETVRGRANYLRAMMYACWVLSAPIFKEHAQVAHRIEKFLEEKLPQLTSIVDAELFISDPERREEFARQCIAAVFALPIGETKHIAEDRLHTLDSAERARVIEETRKSQERAREVREALARQEAEEAASKWSRE